MTRPRLALLNASREPQDTRRNFRRELDADLAEFHVADEQYPSDFEYDGFVVTGSGASVYWDEPWIRGTKEWVGEAIDRGLPALGICFGHQLLADVLGGTVADMGEYEIGYRTVERVADDPVLDGLADDFLVFTTHSDAVTALPPGAKRIAANDYGVHGFRKGNVVGIQSHPEYDTTTAEGVTRGKDLPEERIEAVCADITDATYADACGSKVIFENFLREVAETRRAAGAAAGD